MVRAEGLEPPHLSILEPKSSASTNSATRADAEGARAYSKDAPRGNPRPAQLARSVRRRDLDATAAASRREPPTTPPPTTAASRRSPASRPSRRPKRRRTAPTSTCRAARHAGHRRRRRGRSRRSARRAKLAAERERSLRSRAARVVIMRARGIEEDQVELAVDHRADRRGPCATARRRRDARNRAGSRWRRGTAAAAATASGNRPPAPHPVQALEHRRDFRRGHVRAELRHLLVGALALADQVAAALQAGDEADPVEIRPVERPVLDLADVVEQDRTAAPVPRPRRRRPTSSRRRRRRAGPAPAYSRR